MDLPQVILTIAVAVVSGGVGASITLAVDGSRARREARGRVRASMILAQAARRRLVGSSDSEAREDFYSKVAQVEADSIAAGLPAKSVSLYTTVLQSPKLTLVDKKLLEAAESNLIDVLWHPVRSRPIRRKSYAALERRFLAAEASANRTPFRTTGSESPPS